MKWADLTEVAKIAVDLVRLLMSRNEDTVEAAARRVHERAIILHKERRARVKR